MVFTELSAVAPLGTTLAKEAAEKIPYSPLDLKPHLQQDLNHVKYMHE